MNQVIAQATEEEFKRYLSWLVSRYSWVKVPLTVRHIGFQGDAVKVCRDTKLVLKLTLFLAECCRIFMGRPGVGADTSQFHSD